MGLRRCLAIGVIWQLLIDVSLASALATITPCPECGSSIAPAPVTITAQYQTVPTCTPSTTTVFATHTKRHTTRTTSKIDTIAECSDYAWVSTTIPAYYNWSQISTVVTTTDQPVTFSSLHYTETHTTVHQLESHHVGSKGRYHNGTYHNATRAQSTTKTSYTTIDVKSYCDYDDIGPLPIAGYRGSGLCTDCGPDARSALTQRFTVVSCSDKHCTTFNETWIATPMTYSSISETYTVTTTATYCPTATPESAIPGHAYPTQSSTSTADSEHPAPTPPSPTGYASQSGNTPPTSPGYQSPSARPPQTGSSSTTCSTPATPTHASEYSPHSTPPTMSDGHPNPEPTDHYGGADPSADVSGDLGYDRPEPTAYHRGRDKYKLFKRQGLEKPRGKVMRRSGLLFWGS